MASDSSTSENALASRSALTKQRKPIVGVGRIDIDLLTTAPHMPLAQQQIR
jgi:hypothetical protein